MSEDAAEQAQAATKGKKPKRTRKRGRTRKRAATGGRARPRRRAAAPFPPVPFESVLALADAIQTHGAGQKTRRLTLFEKLERSPDSSVSRLLIINSGRYGVTTGGYKAEFLELTPLGDQATDPEGSDKDKLLARFRLAIEGIPAFKFLYETNRGNRVPSPEVMRDSLAEQAIAEDQRKECVDVFLENMKSLGLLRTIAGAERIISIEQVLEEAPGALTTPKLQVGAPTDVRKADGAKHSWKSVCFVIAPIGEEGSEHRKHSDMILETLISRALEGEDYDVIRADRITDPGMISGQVVEYLLNSALVIADLSFHNPNVFYELAIRHVIGKPTVHIIRKEDAIPFDLKDFRTITIDTSDKYDLVAKLDTYRAEIANHVRIAAAGNGEVPNPVRTFARGLVVSVNGGLPS